MGLKITKQKDDVKKKKTEDEKIISEQHRLKKNSPTVEKKEGATWTVPVSYGQAVTYLLWEFLLLLTWPRPVQPGVGHLRTFSYIATTSYRQEIGVKDREG